MFTKIFKRITLWLTMLFLCVLPIKADTSYTITFQAGSGGEFSDGSKTNTVSYQVESNVHIEKYSHTSNIDDTGAKLSNYGNNWTNANIAGTNRGDASKAHVVTIDGATELTVDLYFNGESVNYDWVSVWAGSYPDYTAASNYGTPAGKPTTEMGTPNTTNKYGGSSLTGVTFGTYEVNGNTLTNVGHVTLTIPGDSVTFAFKSDGSGYGQGYGYYAIVSYDGDIISTTSGEYKEPVGYPVNNEQQRLKEWVDSNNNPVDISTIRTNTTVYATYEDDIIAKGDYWKIKGDGTLIIGLPGNLSIPTFTNFPDVPWYQYRDQITSAEVSPGVQCSSTAWWFYITENLSSVDLSHLDTSNVTTMQKMFYGCHSLESLDLSNFNTHNVKNMNNMFAFCSSLTSLDLSNFDTSNVTDMSCMFFNCDSFTSLDLSSFDTSNVTNVSNMFYDCNSMTNLDLSSFDTSSVTNMKAMFDGCNSLTSLDLSNFDTSNVINMEAIFRNCKALQLLNLSSFNTSNVTNMSYMFDCCISLTSLDVSNFDTSKVTGMGYMFDVCKSLTSIDVSNFDTSNVTSMVNMFESCSSLTNLDVSNFDTSNVTNMQCMFAVCSSLANLDVSNFDTSKVTNMGQMFSKCDGLSNLDLRNFDTSSVTNMNYMFDHCRSLAELDVSNFNTSNVTAMGSMFDSCSSLTNLDLSNFDTSNVTTLSNMFQYCNSLISLDIGNFDTSKATYMINMFKNDNAIQKIVFGKNMGGNTDARFPTTSLPTSITDWTHKRDGSGKAIYDESQYTSAQLMAMSEEDLAGTWVRAGYIDNHASGDEYEYISSDDLTGWSVIGPNTWQYKFKVFDDTIQYWLYEEPFGNYTSDVIGGYQVINENGNITKTAVIRNTKAHDQGKLIISKTVENPEGIDNESFEFTVTLGGGDFTGTRVIDDVIFTDGVGKIKLKDGQTKEFNLPNGTTYSVTETTNANYTLKTSSGASGTIATNKTRKASFTNKKNEDPKPEDVGYEDVIIKKTVDSNYDAFGKKYKIKVLLNNLEPNKEYKLVSGEAKQLANDINLYFIIDVSNSMLFPGELIDLHRSSQIRNITASTFYATGEDILYVQSDISSSQTVYAVFQLDNSGRIVGNLAQSSPRFTDIGATGAGVYVMDASYFARFMAGINASYSGRLKKASTVTTLKKGDNAQYELYKSNDNYILSFVDGLNGLYHSTNRSNRMAYVNEMLMSLGRHEETIDGVQYVVPGIEELIEDRTLRIGFETFASMVYPPNGGTPRWYSWTREDGSLYPLGILAQQLDLNTADGTRQDLAMQTAQEFLMYNDEYDPENDLNYLFLITDGLPNPSGITVNQALKTTGQYLEEIAGRYGFKEMVSLIGMSGTPLQQIQSAILSGTSGYSPKFTANITSLRDDIEEFIKNNLAYSYVYNYVQTYTADSNGTGYVEFEIEDMNEYKLKNLPVGATYQIIEEEGDYISSYTITDANELNKIVKSADANTTENKQLSTSEEVVDSGENITVTYNNKLVAYENLLLALRVDSGPEDYDFLVEAYFDNLEPNKAYDSDFGRIIADGDGYAEKTFIMKHGDRAQFYKLPVGARYKFVETKSPYVINYEITDAEELNQIISPEAQNELSQKALETEWETIEKGEVATVLFINNQTDVNITLTKTVSGNMGDRHRQFQFTVTYNGEPRTYLLADGDSVEITIPANTEYTIAEEDLSGEGYRTYINGSVLQRRSITSTASEDTTVSFENIKNVAVPTEIRFNYFAGIPLLLLVIAYIVYKEDKKKLNNLK